MTPFHAAALEYQFLGLHPIPCRPKSKVPAVKWQDYQERQPEIEEINQWWEACPDYNVALVMAHNIFAVDLDGGAEAAKLFEERGIKFPLDCPVSRTANGFHVLLSAPGPVPDRVALLKAPEGGPKAQVDIRGVGIIVAPPSIHPSGAIYAWEKPLVLPLPSAPRDLLDLIQTGRMRQQEAHQGTSWVLEALRGVAQGERDQTCAKLAGYLLHAGLDAATTEAILSESFAPRCTPPFEPSDVRKTVQSIARKDKQNQRPDDRQPEIVKFWDAYEAWEKSGDEIREPRIPTPFSKLNDKLDGGWGQGELYYLGARPGVGKTSLALEAARYAAEQKTGVLFISREMIVRALIRRMVSQRARIRASTLKRWTLAPEDREALGRYRDLFRSLPVWLTDDVETLGQIDQVIENWKADLPLGLLVIDYLQLIHGTKKERRYEVEEVSAGLKSVAVRHKLPVLCLSSLARLGKDQPNRRPQLSDLRESGQIEHDADVVMFLWREHEKATETELILRKHRDGPLGTLFLTFLPAFTALEEDLSRTEDE